MSWTCPHCQKSMEEPAGAEIRFCLHCGMPASGEGSTAIVDAGSADRRLRLVMTVFGLVWLVLFLLPWGQASFGMVMSWDLLRDREGMAYLVSWPLILSVVFLVLGVVGPLPAWARSIAALVLGLAALITFGTAEPGGPFGRELQFLFSGNAPWLLMFPAVGLGLLARVHLPRSIGARVLISVGLVLALFAYLTGRDGESTLVGALLKYFGDGSAGQVFGRIMMLLPLFLVIASAVGFRMPEGAADPAKPWSRGLGWVLLLYLPVLLLVQGIVLSASEESGWFFLMFLRLSMILAGILAALALSVPWIFDLARRHVLPWFKKSEA